MYSPVQQIAPNPIARLVGSRKHWTRAQTDALVQP
jgi:hypothetical protein